MRITLSILISLVLMQLPIRAQVRVQLSKQEITSSGKRYYMHTVTRNQTLYSLAKAYQVSEEAIIEKNPFVKNGIKVRQSLLIPTQETYKEWLDKKKPAPKSKTPAKDTIKKDDAKRDNESIKEDVVVRTGKIRPIASNGIINITMMLPLKDATSRENENFADFYKGSLVALDVLKSSGISTNLRLISTAQNLELLTESDELNNTNLIIGPVYKESFTTMAKYATKHHIPIVSPLATINGVESPYVFQAAPTESKKYDKLKPILNSDEHNTIILRHNIHTDEDLVKDITAIAKGAPTVNYSKEGGQAVVTSMLRTDKENVVVVPIDNESAVEEVLSRLSSINTMAKYKITVIGSSRWARFNNINFEMFFKLNTLYVTNYHSDRSNAATTFFYKNYIKAFGTMPTMFSMRGYDVTLLFVSAIDKFGSDMPLRISDFNNEPLQVKYKFTQRSDTEPFINNEWQLVNYTPQFNITVN